MSPSLVTKVLRAPRTAGALAMAVAKGWMYKRWYPLRGVRFTAGKRFKVFGRLTVRGPGQVVFGDDCVVSMHVTPFTHHADAIIRVGNHCFLNGTRFGCEQRIDVGDDCILADARLMDTSFHSTRADRWSPDAPVRVRPIVLERNVWVAAQAGILPGTRIGENSVVGFGAVASGQFPANVIIAGNPARVVRPIDAADAADAADRADALDGAVPR